MAGERTSEIDPILLAAAELFERQGYDRTSVVEIAARSGFARSTVFSRYASKQALLVGIVRAFHAALRRVPAGAGPGGAGRVLRGVDGPRIPAELSRAVQRVREACQRLGALARVGSAAQELPWIRNAIEDDVAAITELLRGWLGELGPDELARDLLWDVFRRGCIAPVGHGPADVGNTTRLIAMLRSWEPPRCVRPVRPRGPQARAARLPA